MTDINAVLFDAGNTLDGRAEQALDAVGLRGHFEFVIDSGLVGVDKPDPRIFHLALERMGVAPHQAVYVGDIYEIDVQGARAAGMRAILVGPAVEAGRQGLRAHPRHPRPAGPAAAAGCVT